MCPVRDALRQNVTSNPTTRLTPLGRVLRQLELAHRCHFQLHLLDSIFLRRSARASSSQSVFGFHPHLSRHVPQRQLNHPLRRRSLRGRRCGRQATQIRFAYERARPCPPTAQACSPPALTSPSARIPAPAPSLPTRVHASTESSEENLPLQDAAPPCTLLWLSHFHVSGLGIPSAHAPVPPSVSRTPLQALNVEFSLFCAPSLPSTSSARLRLVYPQSPRRDLSLLHTCTRKMHRNRIYTRTRSFRPRRCAARADAR
jgi:hypothetical protein